MAAKKTKTTYWFFNTDESESEGEGAHRRMIDQSASPWEPVAPSGKRTREYASEHRGGSIALDRISDPEFSCFCPRTLVFNGEEENMNPPIPICKGLFSCRQVFTDEKYKDTCIIGLRSHYEHHRFPPKCPPWGIGKEKGLGVGSP